MLFSYNYIEDSEKKKIIRNNKNQMMLLNFDLINALSNSLIVEIIYSNNLYNYYSI